jgi:LacI family transcriptional regulator
MDPVGRQSGRATIESVAVRAQVSRQTVSNALNSPGRLRPETLERVLGVVAELGYRPNQAARALRTQATRVIGCRLLPSTMPATTTSGGTGGVLDRFLHSLCDAARERRHDVLTFAAHNDDDEIAIYDDLIRRTVVDGFVIAGTHFIDPRTDWLLDHSAPFVAFGRPWGQQHSRHSWVDVDGAAGSAEAVGHLVEQGHRRIGYLGWPEGSGVGDDRRRGWFEALEARGLPAHDVEGRGDDGIDVGAALAAQLLESAQPPTAFVCVSDTMALGALRTLEDRGLVAGTDIAIVGFDDSPVAGLVRPGLSSIRQPIEAVAEKVIEILLDHLAGRPDESAQELIPPALVVRASSDPHR